MYRTKALVLGCILSVIGCGSMPQETDTSTPQRDGGTAEATAPDASDTVLPILHDSQTVNDAGTNCGALLLCDGVCVLPEARVHHCGACGVECCGAHTVVCGCSLSNACIPIQCATGFADCDGDTTNGCETDTTSDVENCGGCGVPHTTVHRCQGTSASCSRGRCI